MACVEMDLIPGCVGAWEAVPIGYLGWYLVVWIGSRDHVCHSSILIFVHASQSQGFRYL